MLRESPCPGVTDQHKMSSILCGSLFITFCFGCVYVCVCVLAGLCCFVSLLSFIFLSYREITRKNMKLPGREMGRIDKKGCKR